MTALLARNAARTVACTGIALALSIATASSAGAAADGPIDLGSATVFGVLAGAGVTSTVNPGTVVTGDMGLSPEADPAAITGFPPALLTGTVYQADAVSGEAQTDLGTAMVEAAGRTPLQSGLSELGGLDLGPGTYSGGALQVTGTLTLTGDADSIFIFQAASTLVTAPNAQVLLEGGATWCNVFWQVGSSATLDTATDFVGTVMASASITANAGTVVEGRLLAQSGAVTLDTTTVGLTSACVAGGPAEEEEGEEPTDDGGEPDAGGVPDDTATDGGGEPDDGATDGGSEPDGGEENGTPVTASAPELAATGSDVTVQLIGAMLLFTGGLTLAIAGRSFRNRLDRGPSH